MILYKLVGARFFEEFEELVQRHLAEGWACQGGICLDGRGWPLQAMVLKKSVSDAANTEAERVRDLIDLVENHEMSGGREIRAALSTLAELLDKAARAPAATPPP